MEVLSCTRKVPFTHAIPPMLSMCFATWVMPVMPDCKKPSNTFWIHNITMAAGVATSLALDEVQKPIGPCHYGMGTLFMQVEYPFRNYNLFVYVYVLSFYNRAKEDKRFLEALKALESKMVHGQIVVERVVPKLAKFSFCKKGTPSALATIRYHEI